MTIIISDLEFRKLIVSSLDLENMMIALGCKNIQFGESLKMNKILKMVHKFDKELSEM
jgi:hypothetical protein